MPQNFPVNRKRRYIVWIGVRKDGCQNKMKKKMGRGKKIKANTYLPNKIVTL